MKKYFRLFIAVIMTASVCTIMTSCDPDEVDAFAKGYRDGYYGTYGTRTDMPNTDATETAETGDDAEL